MSRFLLGHFSDYKMDPRYSEEASEIIRFRSTARLLGQGSRSNKSALKRLPPEMLGLIATYIGPNVVKFSPPDLKIGIGFNLILLNRFAMKLFQKPIKTIRDPEILQIQNEAFSLSEMSFQILPAHTPLTIRLNFFDSIDITRRLISTSTQTDDLQNNEIKVMELSLD